MVWKDGLESKIIIPKPFYELLPRKSIAAIIDNASLEEAICLIAPYGYGKTMTVVSWLIESGRDAVWLTLDDTDNTEIIFLADLSAAIMRLCGWSGVLYDILSCPQFLDNPRTFLLGKLSDVEKATNDRILVLDCFQFIKEPRLLSFIRDFLTSLLGRWRIVLISRAELPSVFNELLFKRHICLISLDELNFDTGEITEFFNINSLPEQDAIHIKEETEGWPVALNVILTLSRSGDVGYGEAARSRLMDFFETEIWNNLNDDIREFLLKTSVLEKLTPASCNAVTDLGETFPMLRWLFVNGLFIFKLEKVFTYRHHRVFRSFLLDKLEMYGIDRNVLYKKYAWWLFERGDYEQAFTCFFNARDFYGLFRTLRIINSADTGIERYLELINCVTTLNIDELHSYPLIVAKIALIHYSLGDIEQMQRIYAILLERLKQGESHLSPDEYAECVWEAGWLSYLNPAEPILDNIMHEEWLNYTEYDPYLKKHHQVRAAVYRFPSMLRGIRDYCPILNNLEEYLQQSPISDDESLWRLDIVRAEYAYELEKFALAEEIIKSLIPEFEERQHTDIYFICIALLVKIVRAVHDPKEISALVSQVETMIHKNNHTFLLPRFHAFELRNRLADGITGQTEAFKEDNEAYAQKPYFYLLYRHMTLVRALLSTQNYNEATLLLTRMESTCRLYNRVMDLIEVYILRAIADFGLGNKDGACKYLTDAIDNAREYGFIRIFSDDAKDIWPILEIIGGKTKDAYVARIIISCKKTLARTGIRLYRKARVSNKLTKTELKILKVLHTDLSYEEIALDNNIKLSTVKSHIHSIYSKLGVDSRASAIMVAKNMGHIE